MHNAADCHPSPFPSQGRIITGVDLCTSLDRMYNAFAGKAYEPTGSAKMAPGAMIPKSMTTGELEDMVNR